MLLLEFPWISLCSYCRYISRSFSRNTSWNHLWNSLLDIPGEKWERIQAKSWRNPEKTFPRNLKRNFREECWEKVGHRKKKIPGSNPGTKKWGNKYQEETLQEISRDGRNTRWNPALKSIRIPWKLSGKGFLKTSAEISYDFREKLLKPLPVNH